MEDEVVGTGGQGFENQPIQASDFDQPDLTDDGMDDNGFPRQEESNQPQGGQEGDQDAGDNTPKFKTPDGRELTAEEFQQEYAKLNSEFTRRSQRLAELEKISEQINNKPDYTGLSAEERQAREILDGLKRDAVEQAKSEVLPMIEEFKIRQEIADLQSKYPDFDPNEVIPFALDNHFRDLGSAYKVLTYERKIEEAKEAATRAATTNLTRRGPAAGNPIPGGQGGKPAGGLQRYDSSKDGNKSVRELLEEGLSEMGLQ